MNLGVSGAALAAVLLFTGCDACLMPPRPERYAPGEEGLTLGYENPSLTAEQRRQERFQVRVKDVRPSAAGRVVVETMTTLGGSSDLTFLQSDGGVSLGAGPEGHLRILPAGFPERTSRWEDRGIYHWVVGRASVQLPGVSFGEPGPVLGVWVEAMPLHGPGPRSRTLYLPGVGEAETLVWKDGRWQCVFQLVSRGFTDVPKHQPGVAHE